jgi:DNA-binding FadR family transcriptional regulator
LTEPGSLIRQISGRSAARNFHSFVISDLGTGIVSGRFPVGSILPNDAAMMDKYNVSRTVLREALKTLEAKGLVEARPKVGTRVSPRSRWNMFDIEVLSWHFETKSDRSFVDNLFDVRRSLELPAADRAAELRTGEHIRLLKYWAYQMDLSRDQPEPFALAELELHRLIMDASQNPFLRSACSMVELSLAVAVSASIEVAPDFDRSDQIRQHNTLVASIENADSDAARAAMASIIDAERTLSLGAVSI